MPSQPVRVTRGEVAELAGQVGGLQREVHDLIGILNNAVKQSEQAKKDAAAAQEAAKANPTRAEVNAYRKRFIGWALVVLLLSTFVTVGVITTTVSECFLNQSHVSVVNGKKVVELGPGGTWGTMCGWIPGYRDAMRKGNQQQRQFGDLLKEIPQNHREIVHLKKVLRRHGIRG